MTNYRAICKTDDFRTKHMMQPSSSILDVRTSKKLDSKIVEELIEIMKKNPPVGKDAVAWAERTDKYGLQVFVKYTNVNGTWTKS